jgi:hypothetical protein
MHLFGFSAWVRLPNHLFKFQRGRNKLFMMKFLASPSDSKQKEQVLANTVSNVVSLVGKSYKDKYDVF